MPSASATRLGDRALPRCGRAEDGDTSCRSVRAVACSPRLRACGLGCCRAHAVRVSISDMSARPSPGPPASSPRFEPNAETVTRGSRLRAEMCADRSTSAPASGGDRATARAPAASSTSPTRSRPRRARRAARPREVDRRVAPRAAAEERRVGPARPFDEHLLDQTDPRRVPARRHRAGRPRRAAPCALA